MVATQIIKKRTWNPRHATKIGINFCSTLLSYFVLTMANKEEPSALLEI